MRQLERPLAAPGEAAVTGTRGEDAPGEEAGLLERGLEAGNLRCALHPVRGNQGAPGVDGMPVDALGDSLQAHWPTIRAAVVEGSSVPQPVRRTDIPQVGGGTRNRGRPPGLARFIEPALFQVLQAAWAPTVSERRDGLRPPRSAPQAVAQAQAYIRDGYPWMVASDLEKCVDRGNHDVGMSRGRRRGKARRGLILIPRFLQAGGLTLEGSVEPTAEGTPQGGPRLPLLAHRVRDERAKEREPRGHRFARYAAEANSYGRSRQAGDRGRASGRRLLERKLRRKVHEAKSAVDRPWNRRFLGCTCTRRHPKRRKGREKALQAFQAQGRAIPGRPRGRTMRQIGQALRQLILGGRAVFGVAEVRSPRRDLDQGNRRRLRRDHGQPWGRKGDRPLRKRGVGRHVAWNTVQAAHGPWRLRQSPALARALPQRSVAALGLPSLFED